MKRDSESRRKEEKEKEKEKENHKDHLCFEKEGKKNGRKKRKKGGKAKVDLMFFSCSLLFELISLS